MKNAEPIYVPEPPIYPGEPDRVDQPLPEWMRPGPGDPPMRITRVTNAHVRKALAL